VLCGVPTRWLQGPDNTLDFGGVTLQFVHRNGGHTPGDMLVYLPATGVVFTGDVVYTDRILGLHPVSKTKTWVASFEALEALKPKVLVPGHGSVTNLAQAQRDTGHLLKALRAHMGKGGGGGHRHRRGREKLRCHALQTPETCGRVAAPVGQPDLPGDGAGVRFKPPTAAAPGSPERGSHS
jgi:glyoxylase-like metal-dependent hydrolase (beta-lactamase superfamily II)